MILYIANGLGFSELQRIHVLEPLVHKLEHDLGFTCVEPFRDNNELSLSDKRGVDAEYAIGHADVQGVRLCDALLCVVSNFIPDEGAMVEVGLAIAWGKPVFLLNDDFRMKPVEDKLPLNLMIFMNTPRDRWKDYYYTSATQLSDPKKALTHMQQYTFPLRVAFSRLQFLAKRLHTVQLD